MWTLEFYLFDFTVSCLKLEGRGEKSKGIIEKRGPDSRLGFGIDASIEGLEGKDQNQQGLQENGFGAVTRLGLRDRAAWKAE